MWPFKKKKVEVKKTLEVVEVKESVAPKSINQKQLSISDRQIIEMVITSLKEHEDKWTTRWFAFGGFGTEPSMVYDNRGNRLMVLYNGDILKPFNIEPNPEEREVLKSYYNKVLERDKVDIVKEMLK